MQNSSVSGIYSLERVVIPGRWHLPPKSAQRRSKNSSITPPLRGESQKSSRMAKASAVGGSHKQRPMARSCAPSRVRASQATGEGRCRGRRATPAPYLPTVESHLRHAAFGPPPDRRQTAPSLRLPLKGGVILGFLNDVGRGSAVGRGRRCPPPHRPSPFGSASATLPQRGCGTWSAGPGSSPDSGAGWKSMFPVYGVEDALPGARGVPPACYSVGVPLSFPSPLFTLHSSLSTCICLAVPGGSNSCSNSLLSLSNCNSMTSPTGRTGKVTPPDCRIHR